MQCSSQNIFCLLGIEAKQKKKLGPKQRKKLECYISEENVSPIVGNMPFDRPPFIDILEIIESYKILVSSTLLLITKAFCFWLTDLCSDPLGIGCHVQLEVLA